MTETLFRESRSALKRIDPFIRKTPLEYSSWLSRKTGGQVYLKLENLQVTGSFKIRGAANRMLTLSDGERRKGIVTASSGNHGAAVAFMLERLGMKGTIYLPRTVARSKADFLQAQGADIVFFGKDCIEAERKAKEDAARQDRVYISPYNDMRIVAGQGTLGFELLDLPEFDFLLSPVGGGGLISGAGSVLRSKRPLVQIIGCQPRNSAVMAHSVKAGRILDMASRPTLSDGTAGGIEQGAVTFGICQKVVDRFILVSEKEIKNAVRFFIGVHAMLVEGSGALTAAALIREKVLFRGKTVVLIVSGSRLGFETLKRIMK